MTVDLTPMQAEMLRKEVADLQQHVRFQTGALAASQLALDSLRMERSVERLRTLQLLNRLLKENVLALKTVREITDFVNSLPAEEKST